MDVTVSGKIGPSWQNDGTENEIRIAKTGEQVMTDAHPNYFESSSRGLMFSAGNQAAQAVSVALATTYTGLCLYNPVGSGTILIPTFIKYALSVAPAGIATIGLITGYAATGGVTAQTTPLTPQNNQIGNTNRSIGIALSAATIVTPTWLMQLADGFTAAALPAPNTATDIRGLYSILPGGFIAIGALTAVTGLGSISWEEIRLA